MLLTPRLKARIEHPYGLGYGRPIRVGYDDLHGRESSILDAFGVVQVCPVAPEQRLGFAFPWRYRD
jgi:hypothetical protein